jgi:hypothetical protein
MSWNKPTSFKAIEQAIITIPQTSALAIIAYSFFIEILLFILLSAAARRPSEFRARKDWGYAMGDAISICQWAVTAEGGHSAFVPIWATRMEDE